MLEFFTYDRITGSRISSIDGVKRSDFNCNFWFIFGCIVLFSLGSFSAVLAQETEPVTFNSSHYYTSPNPKHVAGIDTFVINSTSGALPSGTRADFSIYGGIYRLLSGETTLTRVVNSSSSRYYSYSIPLPEPPPSGFINHITTISLPWTFTYSTSSGEVLFSTSGVFTAEVDCVVAYFFSPYSYPVTVFSDKKPVVLNFDFNDLRQWIAPEDPQTPEELQREQLIADVANSGGFTLPWAANSDGEVSLEIGGISDSANVKSGQNYNFEIGVEDSWDGTFLVNGESYDVNDLDVYQDELGNKSFVFNEDKARSRKNSTTPKQSGVTIEDSSSDAFVVLYENEENGLSVQQRVTVLTNRRTVEKINGEGIASENLTPDAPTNNGSWNPEALTSAVEAIENGEKPFSEHGSWGDTGDDGQASVLGEAREGALTHLEAWRNLKPFESASLPRAQSYGVNIKMGDYGTINKSIPLGHPAVGVVRGIVLAAFSYLLFASFLKKLTI